MGWHDPDSPYCFCEVCEAARQRSKVDCWRLHELLEAGYPILWAELIAASDVDLHEACDLITVRGCPPVTAAKIVL